MSALIVSKKKKKERPRIEHDYGTSDTEKVAADILMVGNFLLGFYFTCLCDFHFFCK